MLAQRIRSKTTPRIDILVYITPYPILHERQFNSCTDRSPVALHPFQVQRYPIISILAGIYIKQALISVSGIGATHLYKDILIPVIVDVGHSDAMPLLEITGARSQRYIFELFSAGIREELVGDHRLLYRIARAKIHVRISVVVDVAKI